LFNRFKNHITSSALFTSTDRLLLAVSGGIDSMVLAYVIEELGYSYEVAHVNHNTRAGASDNDESFVLQYFTEKKIKVHRKNLLIQEQGNFHDLAHKARYQFFHSVPCDKILTAHHHDDHVETIFLNFINGRSTEGIAAVNGKVIRPLLPFTKNELIDFAKQHQVPYVEDASNRQSYYLRNLIRNDIIPLLEGKMPITTRLVHLSERQKAEQKLLRSIIGEELEITQHNGTFRIHKEQLKNKEALYISIALAQYGVNISQAGNLLDCLATIGKTIKTESHTILVDRDDLIIRADRIEKPGDISFELKDLPLSFSFGQIHIQVKMVNSYEFGNENKQYVPAELLSGPITIRTWQEGDHFAPLGLGGKHQKLKQYFADNKIDRFTKDDCPLLCTNDEIVAILGLRTSEEYKITEKHQSFVCLTTSAKEQI